MRTVPDERALKDQAHALLRKGKVEGAAEIYRQLIVLNTKDASLRVHHAELCDRLNQKERAVASYQVAAHLFRGTGQTAKARAAINAGLRVSPEDSGLRRALRELAPPLALVPKLPGWIDEVPPDEALTEPHLVTIDEPGQSNRTVSQRAPLRATPR